MQIDLEDAIATVEELLDGLRQLDGTVADHAPTRAARRQKVEITRTLLYLSHLGNRASVEVMEAYHDFKRHDDPREE